MNKLQHLLLTHGEGYRSSGHINGDKRTRGNKFINGDCNLLF